VRKTSRDPANLALLLLLGLLWSMPFALTKVTLATIPPITAVAARTVLAAASLWVYVFVIGRNELRREHVAPLCVQGCLTCLIPHTLIAVGQQWVDSGLAAILNSATPLYVCLISLGSAGRERLTPWRWLGVAVGAGGVVVTVGAGAAFNGTSHSVGAIAIIVATLSSAAGVVYGRRLDRIPPELAAAGTLTSAAIVLVPLCFFTEAPLAIGFSWLSAGAIVANALAATALGFVIYFRLIRTIGSVSTSSVGYLKPTMGVLIGCALMSEHVTATILFGLCTTLVGIAAIVRPDAAKWRRGVPVRATSKDAADWNAAVWQEP